MRVLVVDDEIGLRESLTRSLRFEGYEVVTAADGPQALSVVATSQPDAVILDVVMPGLDGVETCRRLRASGQDVPVLLLTARGMVTDRIRGLDSGADDYLTKPFAPEELLARLRAMLRRRRFVSADGATAAGGLAVDTRSWTASLDGAALSLTRTEFRLLTALARAAGEVLSRGQLYRDVWGDDELEDSSKTLDAHIGCLRRKLEAGGRPRMVHTVRGVGFKLLAPPPNGGGAS
ncbi:response regulator transcription factor [Jiangella muralis]|uniref:response regulator transcription factor n=1 Tax=Jiangella muralis TaxID=702383 RepID=UPI00069EDC8B|nr:response regulator transcription factor [Jiangella muralis]